MADRLLGVLGHQPLELDLGPLVLEEGGAGRAEHAGEFRPGIGRAHVDDPDRFDPWSRRLDAEQARGLAILDAAPEFLLRGQEQVLIERIGGYRDLDPFAAAGDDREHRQLGIGDPHVVLQLGHVFFGRPSSENDHGSMNLASNTAPVASTMPSRVAAIQRTTGCFTRRWTRGEDLAGVALEPVAIEGFGHDPELDDEVAGEVLRFDLAALFPPQAQQGGLVVAHDDPGVRAADEITAVP